MSAVVKLGGTQGIQGFFIIQDDECDEKIVSLALVPASTVKCLAAQGLIKLIPVCSEYGLKGAKCDIPKTHHYNEKT